MQVTLASLSSLLQEAQLLSKPSICSDILHALDAPSLIKLLFTAHIINTEAAYSSRTAAVHLFTQLTACVKCTWDVGHGATPGSEWDGAVVGCLGGVVRHVCMPNHDTRLGGFKAKHLLRQALAFLKGLVAAVPVQLWSEAWHQVSFYLMLDRSYPSGVRNPTTKFKKALHACRCSASSAYSD